MGWPDRLGRSGPLLVAAVLAANATSAPTVALAAPGGPPALAVVNQPFEAYLGRPFDLTVALVDSSQYPMSVITSGLTESVTLELRSASDPSATLTCASGLTLTTPASGADIGRATFTGCELDRVGTFTVWARPTGDGSIVEATQSAAITVQLPIEAPQPTIKLAVTHSGAEPYFTWGQTVTIRVTFTAHGANQPFELQQMTRARTTWVPIASLVTHADGVATYPYRPSVSTRCRVVFAGSPELAAGTSEQKGFLLFSLARQSPANARPRVIRRGTSVTFATAVRPLLWDLAAARVSFSIYHRVSGAWKLASRRYATVDHVGVARMTLRFGAAGEWYVRSNAMARWAGDPELAPAVVWASRPTPIARFTVR